MNVKGIQGNFSEVGQNVHSLVTDEGILLIAIDTKKNLGPSSTGKSDTVATTGGNISVAGSKLGLNFYRPVDKAVANQRANAALIAAEQKKRDAQLSA